MRGHRALHPARHAVLPAVVAYGRPAPGAQAQTSGQSQSRPAAKAQIMAAPFHVKTHGLKPGLPQSPRLDSARSAGHQENLARQAALRYF